MTNETPETKPDLGVEDRLTLKEKLSQAVVSHSKEILSAVVIGISVTLISTKILSGYFYQENNEGEALGLVNNITVYETETQVHRDYFIKANLAQVMSALSGVKIHLAQHFMMTGKLPVSAEEFDISVLDLDEYDQINSAFITENGGVEVKLSSNFGIDKTLILRATPSKNDAFLKWNCETNVNPQYLGLAQGKICEYSEHL